MGPDVSDWTAADVARYLAFCRAVGIADVTVPVRVWSFESNNLTTAHNPAGASGLFQLEPATAKDIGYPVAGDPDLAKFRAMTVSQQLEWAERYYGAHKGQIGDVASFYVSTWLPVLLPHAGDPTFKLAGKAGPYADAYAANRVFDKGAKGYIVPGDLVAAADSAANSPRSQALLARIVAAATAAA